MKKAFTLPEVLITLGIIGIVASLTTPVLISNYQKQSTVVKLKKTYATLAQMIDLAIIDHGFVKEWKRYDAKGVDNEFTNKYIEPYLLKTIKNSGGVGKTDNYINTIDGNTSLTTFSWYILPNGTAITVFSNLIKETGNYGFIWIFADLNGPKKPNRLGKDIFMFDVFQNGELAFWGQNRNNPLTKEELKNNKLYGCGKNVATKYAGAYCGALIEQNNWEITDDYPW